MNGLPPAAPREDVRRVARCGNADIGRMLAAIAVLVQLALPALYPPALHDAARRSGYASLAFDEHTLCLARDGGGAERPGDRSPAPDDHPFAACCWWHVAVGMAMAPPPAALEFIAFARSETVFAASPQISSRRLTGAVGARAPPARAS